MSGGLRAADRVRRRHGLTRVAPGSWRGGLLGGAATASGIALTATSGWLIVRAAERPVILTLLTAIVAVRAFGMARPVFRYWERLVSHDAALGLLAQRRTDTYRALVPLTPARLGRRRRSDVLGGVVDDLTDEVDAQVRVTVPVVSTAVAGGLVVGLTTALSPPVGAALAVLAAAVVVSCVMAARLESRSLPELLAARAEVARVAALTTSQADQLQAVAGWPTALRWLDEAQAVLAATTRRVSRGRALSSAAFLVSVGATVVWVARTVSDLDASGPVQALLVLTPVAVADAVAPLVDAMRAHARARAAATRVAHLLDLEPAVATQPVPTPIVPSPIVPTPHVPTDARLGEARPGEVERATHAATPDIEVRGLTASWTGARRDLGPIDLHLPAGSRVVVTGANGSGKSTLLAVLARHLDPAGGAVTWNGRDVTTLPLEQVRAAVAVVDDDPHVFAGSLRANLLLAAPDADDAELTAGLVRAGLGPFLAGLPDGLDTVLGATGRGVSGGERARIGVARAVLSGRPVVLLDEPVAHLDPPTARAVVADLLADGALEPNRTIVMVTHRADGLDLFDRVVTLTAPRRTLAPS